MARKFDSSEDTDSAADMLDAGDWQDMLAAPFDETGDWQTAKLPKSGSKLRLIEALREQRLLRMQLEDFDNYVV